MAKDTIELDHQMAKDTIESDHQIAEDRLHSAITIESLEKKIKETKWLLQPSAGLKPCCIFRAPQCLQEINMKTYQPHIVSIGPYHHGEEHLEMMQQHKWRFLHDLLTRTRPTGLRFDDCLQAVAPREDDIRRSYSQTVNICSLELIEMMVLDGLFIIELMFKAERLSPIEEGDPIFNLAWVMTNLIRDLLQLENQIPFFVLVTLFDLLSEATRKDGTDNSSLAQLVKKFFVFEGQTPAAVLEQHLIEARHLLDLRRLSFIPQSASPLEQVMSQLAEKFCSSTGKGLNKFLPGFKSKTRGEDTSSYAVQLIPSATKLHLAGIKFRSSRRAISFLDIKFSKGVLEIPQIILDDLYPDMFLNFVAYEQCCSRRSNKHITPYAAFMSSLIRTPADATFLCDNYIIQNYLGTDKDVANFFRNMGKDLHLDQY